MYIRLINYIYIYFKLILAIILNSFIIKYCKQFLKDSFILYFKEFFHKDTLEKTPSLIILRPDLNALVSILNRIISIFLLIINIVYYIYYNYSDFLLFFFYKYKFLHNVLIITLLDNYLYLNLVGFLIFLIVHFHFGFIKMAIYYYNFTAFISGNISFIFNLYQFIILIIFLNLFFFLITLFYFYSFFYLFLVFFFKFNLLCIIQLYYNNKSFVINKKN